MVIDLNRKERIDKRVPLSKSAPIHVLWWFEEIGHLVEKARRALRRHRSNHTKLAWQEYLEANRVKGGAIRQATRQYFERAIDNACKNGRKTFWRLAE